jgi:hypothetical protein
MIFIMTLTGTKEAAHLAHIQPGTDECNAWLLRHLWRNKENKMTIKEHVFVIISSAE